MKNLLNRLKVIGAFYQRKPQGPALFPHGEHDVSHALHVPAPGRV